MGFTSIWNQIYSCRALIQWDIARISMPSTYWGLCPTPWGVHPTICAVGTMWLWPTPLGFKTFLLSVTVADWHGWVPCVALGEPPLPHWIVTNLTWHLSGLTSPLDLTYLLAVDSGWHISQSSSNPLYLTLVAFPFPKHPQVVSIGLLPMKPILDLAVCACGVIASFPFSFLFRAIPCHRFFLFVYLFIMWFLCCFNFDNGLNSLV